MGWRETWGGGGRTYLDLGLPGPSCSLLGGEVVWQALVLFHLDAGSWPMVWRVVLVPPLLVLVLALLVLLAVEGRLLAVVKEVGSSWLMVLLQRKGAVEREHG